MATTTPFEWKTRFEVFTLQTISKPAMDATPPPSVATNTASSTVAKSYFPRQIHELRAKLNVTNERNKRRSEEMDARDKQLSSECCTSSHETADQSPLPLPKTSATAPVFATPELPEQILLELELHDTGPFRTNSVTNAMRLCRLERVSRHFHDTVTSSTQLLESRTLLRLQGTPTEFLGIAWLLREIGHEDFEVANCETFGCLKESGFWRAQGGCVHVCSYGGVTVSHSPSCSTGIALKRLLRDATAVDEAWRDLKIPRSLTIFFKGRSQASGRVETNQPTLGSMWHRLKDPL